MIKHVKFKGNVADPVSIFLMIDEFLENRREAFSVFAVAFVEGVSFVPRPTQPTISTCAPRDEWLSLTAW